MRAEARSRRLSIIAKLHAISCSQLRRAQAPKPATIEVTTTHVSLMSMFNAPLPNQAFQISFDNKLRLCYGKGGRRFETRLVEFNEDYLRDILSISKLYWRVTGTVHGTRRIFGQFVSRLKYHLYSHAFVAVASRVTAFL